MKKSISLLCIVFLCIAAFSQSARDQVNGNLIQFNDNGAWCWYQDERAVIDTGGEKLITGSDASGSGVGGSARNGDIEAVIFDLQGRESQRYTLKDFGSCDDHNAPAFLVLPNGGYLAMYAGHNNDRYTYYRIYSNGSWGSERTFNWNNISGGTDYDVTYNNPWHLSSEGKIYNFVRNYARSPNMMVSTDQGQSWSYGGLLTEPDQSVGYVNGYFKYCGNGVDRIDFIGTEHHPRDYNTSIYHGYIQGGQSYNSSGSVMDSNITDKSAPTPASFTRVFAANTSMGGVQITRCWMSDIQTYGSNSIAIIFSGRANNSESDHRYIYARFSGSSWSNHYLCKAGAKMYSSEEDYVGLAAIDPSNPDVIYVSTPINPQNDSTNLGVREIFKGETSNQGSSWTWTPITENSVRDNFRPIVPKWDSQNTALLWWRGTYNTAQNFDAAVVGIISSSSENTGPMSFIDATTGNTTLANGSSFNPTGPGPGSGAADNQWHQQTSVGNGGYVLASAESGGENAPTLRTRVTVSQSGTFDVWVNFWGNPGSDWRVKAGLAENRMQIYRQMACKQVDSGAHRNSITLNSGNYFLYQAYVGRVTRSSGGTIDVYVDDEAVRTGSTSQASDTVRTWYDGISIADTGGGTITPGGTTGDVNNDGSIDIVDALLTAQYYVGLNPSNFDQSRADANCNGTIDIVDALLIAQYYVGLVDHFC